MCVTSIDFRFWYTAPSYKKTFSMYSKMSLSSLRMKMWPIYRRESKLFLLMSGLFFCVLFNTTGLRIVKDTLIVTRVGAEAISFLKGWIVLPTAVLYVVAYTKLSNITSPKKLYFLGLCFFISAFALFGFVMYPLGDLIHPSPEAIQAMIKSYPHLKYFLSLYGVWSYCFLYTVAELWCSVGIHLLFWQLANEIVATGQAKRFYPLFGVVGNFALVFAGTFIHYMHPQYNICGSFDGMIQILTTIVCISGIIVAFLYTKVTQSIATEKNQAYTAGEYKMSFRESIKFILNSNYLRYIALIVVCYGITVNFAEITWKSQVNLFTR